MIRPRQISLLIKRRLGESLWTPESNVKESCWEGKRVFGFSDCLKLKFFLNISSGKILCLDVDHDMTFSSPFSFSSSFLFSSLLLLLLEASSYSSSFRPLGCKFDHLGAVSYLVTAKYFPLDFLKTTNDASECRQWTCFLGDRLQDKDERLCRFEASLSTHLLPKGYESLPLPSSSWLVG